jgi:hypothetical protein
MMEALNGGRNDEPAQIFGDVGLSSIDLHRLIGIA